MSDDRILMIGCPGSGKSTLTRELVRHLELPVLHLDRVFHAEGFDQTDRQALADIQKNFMESHQRFIVDGNYASTLEVRLRYANLVIWFQIPKRVTMYRVIRRSVRVKLGLEVRSDIAEGFVDKFDREFFEFLKYVWDFEKAQVPMMEEALTNRNSDCRLVVIKNKHDKKTLLKELVR
ncbi:MAG: hypothetical protein FWE07_03945 [Turicibacter sp.]|nr:hypothetical protein [Turicibacter sp.]